MTGAADRDGGRRWLQWTLGVLACIPTASGLAGMLAGPSTLPGGENVVTATLDSEYRFVNAFWFATGPVIWSALPAVEEETTRLRLVMAVVFLGGIARVASWRRTGRPHPMFVGAIALEIVGMPVVARWQHHIAAVAASRR